MRRFKIVLIAAGLLVFAAPAQAATKLDCMSSGYSDGEQAQFEAYFAAFDFQDVAASVEPIAPIVDARAVTCAAEHGWSEAASGAAIEHRRATLIREALVRVSPASAEGLTAMDAAIAATNPIALRRVLGAAVAGRGAMNTYNLSVVMPIFQASGLPMSRDNGVFVGAWLAATWAMSDRETLFNNS